MTLSTIDLVNNFLIVDSLEELSPQRNIRRYAEPLHLVEERVGDELQALLDQLVVDFALPLDLLGRLKSCWKTCLELAESHVVKPRCVDMVARDAPLGFRAQLDGAGHGPI